MELLLYTLVLSIAVGFELIHRVPSQLHTPLMSGANAISGVILLALFYVELQNPKPTLLGAVAVFFATFNVVGGYLLTDRMLKTFKKQKNAKTD